jgi:hypothetical protein
MEIELEEKDKQKDQTSHIQISRSENYELSTDECKKLTDQISSLIKDNGLEENSERENLTHLPTQEWMKNVTSLIGNLCRKIEERDEREKEFQERILVLEKKGLEKTQERSPHTSHDVDNVKLEKIEQQLSAKLAEIDKTMEMMKKGESLQRKRSSTVEESRITELENSLKCLDNRISSIKWYEEITSQQLKDIEDLEDKIGDVQACMVTAIDDLNERVFPKINYIERMTKNLGKRIDGFFKYRDRRKVIANEHGQEVRLRTEKLDDQSMEIERESKTPKLSYKETKEPFQKSDTFRNNYQTRTEYYPKRTTENSDSTDYKRYKVIFPKSSGKSQHTDKRAEGQGMGKDATTEL